MSHTPLPTSEPLESLNKLEILVLYPAPGHVVKKPQWWTITTVDRGGTPRIERFAHWHGAFGGSRVDPGAPRGRPESVMRADPPGFYLLAITPPKGPVDGAIVEAWGAGRAVGMAVLLREPGTPPRALVGDDHRLAPLRRACVRVGLPCVLSVDVADLSGLREALGVAGIGGIQLRGDPSAAQLVRARRLLPAGHVLGRSCRADSPAMGTRVDYSVLAPIFTPRTASPEPGPGKRAVGLAPLRALAAHERRVFALGGITPDNAAACIRAGAFGLAAIRSFFGPPARVADNVARLARVAAPADDAAPPP